MKRQIQLISSTVTGSTLTPMVNVGDGTTTLHAFIDTGAATIEVYGRMEGGPRPADPLVTFDLSGANDSGSYILDKECWPVLEAIITAISGGARATLAAGV